MEKLREVRMDEDDACYLVQGLQQRVEGGQMEEGREENKMWLVGEFCIFLSSNLLRCDVWKWSARWC